MDDKQSHRREDELDDAKHSQHRTIDNDANSDSGSSLNDNEGPSPEVVALREGYNQTYIIKKSKTALHDILFRCGNWCYTGRVDLGDPEIGLSELVAVVPALQKQQGSLQFLCEWKRMPASSQFTKPLHTLYDAFDFIGNELVSEHIQHSLLKAAESCAWIDDDDARNYFELQTNEYECFEVIQLHCLFFLQNFFFYCGKY